MLQESVGTTEAGARVHDLGRMEGATDDPGIRIWLERETEPVLAKHGQWVSDASLKDGRAVSTPVSEGTVDPEDAGLERSRASADGQEAVETGEACPGGLVEKRAGRRRRRRHPDGISQRVEAASDASEGLADLAERPLLGAHGREV
jgi:hypothetical protein